MRCMVIVKATKDSEAGVMPSMELLTAMGNYNEELVNAGIMKAGEGLTPSSKGARVRFEGTKRTVINGPFAETKELIAGFWVWNVRSLEEAIDWLKRCPNPHNETCELEIRPVFETEDFGEAMTPELREQEDSLRAQIEEPKKEESPRGMAFSKNIFVNLPVKDLEKSKAFFAKLGYTFNPQFSDENATCMIVGENIYVMLLVEEYFQTFTPKPIADAKKNSEALIALSADSRDAVKQIVETALAAGAIRYKEPQDHGFMFAWGFEDLDGHIWEFIWMDPGFVQK